MVSAIEFIKLEHLAALIKNPPFDNSEVFPFCTMPAIDPGAYLSGVFNSSNPENDPLTKTAMDLALHEIFSIDDIDERRDAINLHCRRLLVLGEFEKVKFLISDIDHSRKDSALLVYLYLKEAYCHGDVIRGLRENVPEAKQAIVALGKYMLTPDLSFTDIEPIIIDQNESEAIKYFLISSLCRKMGDVSDLTLLIKDDFSAIILIHLCLKIGKIDEAKKLIEYSRSISVISKSKYYTFLGDAVYFAGDLRRAKDHYLTAFHCEDLEIKNPFLYSLFRTSYLCFDFRTAQKALSLFDQAGITSLFSHRDLEAKSEIEEYPQMSLYGKLIQKMRCMLHSIICSYSYRRLTLKDKEEFQGEYEVLFKALHEIIEV